MKEKFKLIPMTDFVLHSYKKGNMKEEFYGHCCIKKDIKLDILISLKTFVLNLEPTRKQIENYANFLDMKLELGHFVPTDENGNYWKYPPTQEEWDWATRDSMEAEQSFKQKEYYYQKAKEKVLFKGFEVETQSVTSKLKGDFLIFTKTNEIIGHKVGEKWIFKPYIKCEDLIQYQIELTENAIKQWN